MSGGEVNLPACYLHSDFVEDLYVEALEAIGDQSEGRNDIKSAGVSIDETGAHVKITRAMDVVVKNFYLNNAAVLAGMENCTTCGTGAARKKGGTEEPLK